MHGVAADGFARLKSSSYVPAAQTVHEVAASPEYQPAEQTVHGVVGPSVSAYPATQSMHPTIPAPVSVYEPTDEYCPAAQLTHGVDGSLSPSSSPAGHVVHDHDPTGEYLPDAQDSHEPPPTWLRYIPSAHSMHTSAPVVPKY